MDTLYKSANELYFLTTHDQHLVCNECIHANIASAGTKHSSGLRAHTRTQKMHYDGLLY
jgi:hypothetical protein